MRFWISWLLLVGFMCLLLWLLSKIEGDPNIKCRPGRTQEEIEFERLIIISGS